MSAATGSRSRASVGPNGDAHVYAPSPADAKKLADAKVVFTNGLGFEGWIPRLVKASGTKAAVDRRDQGRQAAQVARKPDMATSHADADPHAWQSVANVENLCRQYP